MKKRLLILIIIAIVALAIGYFVWLNIMSSF